MTEIVRELGVDAAEEPDEEETNDGWEESDPEWSDEVRSYDNRHNEGLIGIPTSIDPHALEDMVADSSLAIYFRDITRVPLLTAEQEVELATAYEKGEIAKQQLVTLPSDDPQREAFDHDERSGENARRRLMES